MKYASIADSALAKPPVLEHLLFEQPWTLIAGFLGLGLIFLILSIRGKNGRLAIMSATVVFVAAAMYALSCYVVTNREQMIALTQQAIQYTTTDPIDTSGLKGLMDPDTSIFGPDDRRWFSHDECLTLLADITRNDLLQEQTIVAIQAQTTGPSSGLTRIDLKTMIRTKIGDRHLMTRWLLTWTRTPEDRWVVKKIQWFKYPGPTGLDPTTAIKR